jgi:hypothetical protein
MEFSECSFKARALLTVLISPPPGVQFALKFSTQKSEGLNTQAESCAPPIPVLSHTNIA